MKYRKRNVMWRHGSTSVQPGRRAFVVAGPTAWNSFLDNLRIRTLLQTTSNACWKRFCSQRISAISAL